MESSGRTVIETPAQEGVLATQANPLPVPPAKSVGFALPGESVTQPGSGREVVDRILDGIISGNLQPGRAQTNVADAPLYMGTIPRSLPEKFLPPNVHPGSSSMLSERNNRNLPSVTTMTGVTFTTTTTTQSRETVHSLRNSLSQVMTTSSHGASPGDHPLHPSIPVPLVGSPSPMMTTCSVTSHS